MVNAGQEIAEVENLFVTLLHPLAKTVTEIFRYFLSFVFSSLNSVITQNTEKHCLHMNTHVSNIEVMLEITKTSNNVKIIHRLVLLL